MEEYIEYLRNEFKKYKIFKQVSSYDGKKEHITYHYKLHINGLIKHHFEFKTALTTKELEHAFIDSYIKDAK